MGLFGDSKADKARAARIEASQAHERAQAQAAANRAAARAAARQRQANPRCRADKTVLRKGGSG